jgi:hypothetical protein
MSWLDDAVKKGETAVEWAKHTELAAKAVHYGGVAVQTVKETQFYQDLKPVEKLKEAYAAGKDAMADAKETGLGKALDKGGKVLAIAETLVDYGKGASKVIHGDVDGGGQDISRGVAKIALAATGPGALVEKPFTMALQAYAKHDLGRPLTEKEKKDITFTNMAGDGLNAVLKPAGEALGDAATWVVDKTPKAAAAVKDFVKKEAGEAVDLAKKAEGKVVDGVHAVEDKAGELAAKVGDKAVDLASKAEAKVADVAAKVVPPAVADQARSDYKEAMAKPGAVEKLEGLGHAGQNLIRGIGSNFGL